MLEDLKITKREGSLMTLGSTWVSGTYKDLKFQAQIFGVGSRYGIKRSAVSRLRITRNDKTVYSYERGIDIRSRDPEVQKLKNYIVEHSLEIKNGSRGKRKA